MKSWSNFIKQTFRERVINFLIIHPFFSRKINVQNLKKKKEIQNYWRIRKRKYS